MQPQLLYTYTSFQPGLLQHDDIRFDGLRSLFDSLCGIVMPSSPVFQGLVDGVQPRYFISFGIGRKHVPKRQIGFDERVQRTISHAITWRHTHKHKQHNQG